MGMMGGEGVESNEAEGIRGDGVNQPNLPHQATVTPSNTPE